jgi:hypothetical protein
VVKIRVTIEQTRECEEDGGALLAETVKTSALVFFRQVDRPTKYTICMEKNWNLISLPVQPHAFDAPDLPLMDQIEALLMPIKSSLYEVWTYEGGEWLRFMYDDPSSDLSMMKVGQGYFVRMLWPDCLEGQGNDHCTTGGIGDTPLTFDLDEGWNLTGFAMCDCDRNGVIDRDDIKGECCYPYEPCGDCVSDCWDKELTLDKYFASTNSYMGNNPGFVYMDEIARVLMWEPWGGFVDNPLVKYKMGERWFQPDRCDHINVGTGAWVFARLPGLQVIPPVGEDCSD